jgi:hypothetical protein
MRVVVQASFSESVQYRRQIGYNGLIVESNTVDQILASMRAVVWMNPRSALTMDGMISMGVHRHA